MSLVSLVPVPEHTAAIADTGSKRGIEIENEECNRPKEGRADLRRERAVVNQERLDELRLQLEPRCDPCDTV
jgi:hypothetical protein